MGREKLYRDERNRDTSEVWTVEVNWKGCQNYQVTEIIACYTYMYTHTGIVQYLIKIHFSVKILTILNCILKHYGGNNHIDLR